MKGCWQLRLRHYLSQLPGRNNHFTVTGAYIPHDNWKTVRDGMEVLYFFISMKSHTGFWLLPKSTLNDVEQLYDCRRALSLSIVWASYPIVDGDRNDPCPPPRNLILRASHYLKPTAIDRRSCCVWQCDYKVPVIDRHETGSRWRSAPALCFRGSSLWQRHQQPITGDRQQTVSRSFAAHWTQRTACQSHKANTVPRLARSLPYSY